MTDTDTDLVAAADRLASAAHEGQVDKAGHPYIDHPRRVAAKVAHLGDDYRIVALLHDVVEDTPVTLDVLAATFPGHIVDAVDAITHRAGMSRDDYYAQVAANPLAVQVKFADIADNTDPLRLAALPGTTQARLEAKYAHARTKLRELAVAGRSMHVPQ